MAGLVTKGNNFCDLFTSRNDKAILKSVLLYKGKYFLIGLLGFCDFDSIFKV